MTKLETLQNANIEDYITIVETAEEYETMAQFDIEIEDFEWLITIRLEGGVYLISDPGVTAKRDSFEEALEVLRDWADSVMANAIEEAKDELQEAELAQAYEDTFVTRQESFRQTEATLNAVMTSSEVDAEFGLPEGTAKLAANRNAIAARKSAGTWLIARSDAVAKWGKLAMAVIIALALNAL